MDEGLGSRGPKIPFCRRSGKVDIGQEWSDTSANREESIVETPEEAARRIFGQRASFYTTSGTHTDPEILGRVVKLAEPRPGAAALDVGTGTGHTAFAVAPHVASVTAVDLTSEMIVEARRLQSEQSIANVRFCAADVHNLPFRSEVYPLVTCRRAAHHFSDIGRALLELRRVTEPGGRLVVDDRSIPEDDFVDRTMNLLDQYHDASHVREYRPGEWRHMLGEAGYLVTYVETYTQHRPLSSLTKDVAPEETRKIHDILAGLTDSERAKLREDEIDGEIHLDHYYILVAAVRSDY